LGLFASAVAFFLQVFSDPSFPLPLLTNPWLLTVSRGLAGFSIGIFPPALMAFVYESDNPLGRFNSFGALGYSVGTFVAGLFFFYWNAFVLSSACLWLAFVISLTMGEVTSPRIYVPFFPRSVLRKNWHVYLSFLLRHTGANCIWVVYPLFIASLGADNFWIGVIYAMNFMSQFVFMLLLDRFKGRILIYGGFVLSALTFISFTFAQDYIQLIPMQVLLGGSWSLIYVGSLVYLMQCNPEKATCSGILSAVISLSMVLGSLLGGVIAQLFDYKATMYVATALTLIGLVFFKVGTERNTG
jgi:MFS family permease